MGFFNWFERRKADDTATSSTLTTEEATLTADDVERFVNCMHDASPSCHQSPRCASGCQDFSSRAMQKPDLCAIDVVEGIFVRAFRNMLQRELDVQAGQLTPEALQQANQKLEDWLTFTFLGGNDNYRTAEDWNGPGLAQHLRTVFSGTVVNALPDTDEAMVRLAAERFVHQAHQLCHALIKARVPHERMLDNEGVYQLAFRWAHWMTGAPLEDDVLEGQADVFQLSMR